MNVSQLFPRLERLTEKFYSSTADRVWIVSAGIGGHKTAQIVVADLIRGIDSGIVETGD